MDGENSFVRRIEKRYLHAAGHTVWGELTTSAITPADGARPYVISLVEDITERKQAELDLPAIANVLRRILSGEDAREAIVQAAVDIAGASSAHLAERAGPERLPVTASAGLNLVGVDVRLGAPSATARRTSWASRCSSPIPNGTRSSRASCSRCPGRARSCGSRSSATTT